MDGRAESEDWPAIGATISTHCSAQASSSAMRWATPVPASQLPEQGPDVEWLHEGYIARGHITLFSALMKTGKSTFLGHLLRCLQSGEPFIGRATRQCRTLVVSEESVAIWRRRRDLLRLDDHLQLLCRPMMVKPSLPDWSEFVAHIVASAMGKVDLVILDTLSAFAPWKSENDAAEVMATLTPLNQLTSAGLAVLATHHHGKGDQSQGKASRGSTAIAGAVDVLLELRRFKPNDTEDRGRLLTGLGRFEEIAKEVVITLNEDGTGYIASGDRWSITVAEIHQILLEVLPTTSPGKTPEEIIKSIPDGQSRRAADVRAVLKAGAETGHWKVTGAGKRNDPRRYWRCPQ